MSDTTTIFAGSMLCFSTGEYSDFGYNGHYVALEDLTREALVEIADEVRSSHKKAEEAWDEDPKQEYPGSIHGYFIAALIRKGLLLSITVTELHIGSYGELEVQI